MTLKLIKEGSLLPVDGPELLELNKFSSVSREIVMEWMNGQFWLHSDNPKERPIGIEIDRELQRHEEFFKRSSIHKELFARAIGIKGSYRPKVLDLTGGMLGDSLLLLSFGCEVWATERHPVMRFLIESALQNSHHPLLQNFHFLRGDAASILLNPPPVDVIYFDPMFEDPNEKTSPRKEMRIFREIVGKDQDAIEVFEMALKQSPKRLVVKRPRHSTFLKQKPSVEYIGKSTRYDVYFSV